MTFQNQTCRQEDLRNRIRKSNKKKEQQLEYQSLESTVIHDEIA